MPEEHLDLEESVLQSKQKQPEYGAQTMILSNRPSVRFHARNWRRNILRWQPPWMASFGKCSKLQKLKPHLLDCLRNMSFVENNHLSCETNTKRRLSLKTHRQENHFNLASKKSCLTKWSGSSRRIIKAKNINDMSARQYITINR